MKTCSMHYRREFWVLYREIFCCNIIIFWREIDLSNGYRPTTFQYQKFRPYIPQKTLCCYHCASPLNLLTQGEQQFRPFAKLRFEKLAFNTFAFSVNQRVSGWVESCNPYDCKLFVSETLFVTFSERQVFFSNSGCATNFLLEFPD